jgi:hypothetical protein
MANGKDEPEIVISQGRRKEYYNSRDSGNIKDAMVSAYCNKSNPMWNDETAERALNRGIYGIINRLADGPCFQVTALSP